MNASSVRSASSSLSPAPASPTPSASLTPPLDPPCFFSVTNKYYKKTFPLRAITGHPDDHGYLTMVWAASDRPSEWRPASWVHKHPMTVRNKSPQSYIFLTNNVSEK
jgi:hypothetical protein